MLGILLVLLISVSIVLFVGTASTKRSIFVSLLANKYKAYLALTSCLGDSFRARYSRHGEHLAFDGSYLRTMTNSGPGMSEQIEMQTMLNTPGMEVIEEE